MESGQVSFA